MVTHTHSVLSIVSLSFAGALALLTGAGCTSPAVVGEQSSADVGSIPAQDSMAYHAQDDAETLHLVITTFAVTCDNPGLGVTSGESQACTAGWQVLFNLPSASQVAGTYDLSGSQYGLMAFETQGADANGECMGGGGGGAIPGVTAEVLSIDGSTVKVRLAGFADGGLPAADGDYEVPICP